jgi:RNA polymerase primary sigma factor
LLIRNRRDFAVAVNRRQPKKIRHAAWRRLLNRRTKCVRLVEELGLRTQRLQPMLDKLKQISLRMDLVATRRTLPRRDRREQRRNPPGIVLFDARRDGESATLRRRLNRIAA